MPAQRPPRAEPRRSGTVEMPNRPAIAVSPNASTMPPTRPSDLVIFPSERLATLDQFVRLRALSERVDFLAILAHEGMTPGYYARMVARLDVLRRSDPRLEQAYRGRLEHARAAHVDPMKTLKTG